MEDKEVMIRVTSRQYDDLKEPETISLETPGRFSVRKDGFSISYEESELTGMEGTTTSLFVYPGVVRLVRTGKIMQTQEYRVGEKTSSHYETPAGSMELSVVTKKLENTIENGSGTLSVVYDVELEGAFFHRNELLIELWEDVNGSKRTAENHH